MDRVTYEFESVPAGTVDFLSGKLPVYPPVRALATARDRLHEKNLFNQLGIDTAPFMAVDSLDDLQRAVAKIGLPAILKTRTLGYDGKGQQLCATLRNSSLLGKESTAPQPFWRDLFPLNERSLSSRSGAGWLS